MEDELDRRDFDRLYANYLEVGHNAFEFYLDFGNRRPENSISFHSGIVTSPGYAVAFLEVLEEAVRKYRASYGPIPGPEPLRKEEA
jgi:Protein of unknown function (DUF3467)